MTFDRKELTDQQLIALYEALVKPRLIEEKMLLLLRQGRISKWFSGIGQEAIAVGVGYALRKDEYILPMHRNLGVFTTRDVPLDRLFAQFQGKESGFTKGRDRSFHFGSREHHVIGMISHLGSQLGVADGISLSHRIRKESKVVLVFSGDGGASEGDFHESLNVASVWSLPVIFLIENNGYGLSTPSVEQFNHRHFIDKGHGYGMEAYQVDGNNLLDIYHLIRDLAGQVRKNHRPILIEALTFRMRGHEEASGTKYVPVELLKKWASRDPVENYERYLLDQEILSPSVAGEIKKNSREMINQALKEAFSDKPPVFDMTREKDDMYHPSHGQEIKPLSGISQEKRLVDAISEGLQQACEKFPELILMGQDIAEYGGVFKVTEGLVQKFGKERVRNTPLCESAILGAGMGLSITGMKSVVEMQFADFVTCGFNQIINNIAKSHYRWGQHADIVIRMPTGAGVGAGPFHSQSNEAWFFHTPGLKIVYPSNPFDAKGLLLASVEDKNPVLFFEHKALYRSLKGEVPVDYYTLPIGEGHRVREGTDVSVITYGMGVIWANEILQHFPDVSVDLIDLRSLMPWDQVMVSTSVRKTGKVIILHEDTLTGGIGGEIAAYISENLFEYLDAPVMREAGLDTAIPFSSELEKNFLPPARFREKFIQLLEY